MRALFLHCCNVVLMPFPAVFIAEITARAFIIADSNKRRTLSRADIAKAVSKSDQFDFLIDILPREEPFPGSTGGGAASGSGSGKGKKAAKSSVRLSPHRYRMSSEETFRNRELSAETSPTAKEAQPTKLCR